MKSTCEEEYVHLIPDVNVGKTISIFITGSKQNIKKVQVTASFCCFLDIFFRLKYIDPHDWDEKAGPLWKTIILSLLHTIHVMTNVAVANRFSFVFKVSTIFIVPCVGCG
jgi:hypothetical protein